MQLANDGESVRPKAPHRRKVAGVAAVERCEQMTTRRKVTITNLQGQAERVALPRPQLECEKGRRSEDWTGEWLTGLYVGPRSGRIVRRTYSIWEGSNGAIVGETYDEIDTSTYLRMCEIAGIEPVVSATQL